MSPIQITVRSIPDSPTIAYHINKHFAKIQKVHHKLINCRVVIDVIQNHKNKGKIFSVSIDLSIPGKELASRKQNENLFVAIRDGFCAIETLLKKHVKRKPAMMDKHAFQRMVENYQEKQSTCC